MARIRADHVSLFKGQIAVQRETRTTGLVLLVVVRSASLRGIERA